VEENYLRRQRGRLVFALWKMLRVSSVDRWVIMQTCAPTRGCLHLPVDIASLSTLTLLAIPWTLIHKLTPLIINHNLISHLVEVAFEGVVPLL